MNKKKKSDTKGSISKKSKILYWTAGIVLLIPLLLLAYIYLGAKESSGKPTAGNRFDNSLNPAISAKQTDQLKTSLKVDGVENVEVNLISATLRISIDVRDDANADTITAIMNSSYDQVNGVVPIETYFTNNKKNDKMYDLEIHVYNYIPDEKKPADGQVYMIKTKTSAAKEANVSTPSSPKNKEISDKLLTEQKEAK
ncbi:MAG: hypothetical protein RR986_04650 [Longicatena sp.]